jgi:phospholipase/lecithinase/hemolysin
MNLQELHDLGCRSMAVAGLPPVGYAPIEKTIQLATELLLPVDLKWVDNINSYAQSYNEELVKLLAQAQATLKGSKIVYADVYEPLDDMVKNPKRYGKLMHHIKFYKTEMLRFHHK